MGRSYFHLHLVSDSTGETLIAVGRAVAAQYEGISAIEHVYPLVRSRAQLERVVSEIEAAPGIVLYTLVEPELAERLEQACRDTSSPHLSVLTPVHQLLQSYLGAHSTARPGAQHMLNAEYFKRIDAMNFTLMHDDGQLPGDIEEADIVLLGVSRTSKTPTSIYLANRGLKTTNIPLVPGVPPPPSLERARKPLVVGLLGLLPLSAATGTAVLAGLGVPWWLPLLLLITVAAAFAYVVGILAVRRLGSSVASFVSLTEVIFAVLFAVVLVGQRPSVMQIIGGILVLAGIAVVQRGSTASTPVTDPATDLVTAGRR